MSNHSAGPWVVQDNAALGVHIYSKGGCFGGGSHVCRVSFTAVRSDAAEPGASERQLRANACLIAAAPDMLEALKAYDAAMTSCWGSPDDLPRGNPDAARCWPMARAAIAKAEGITP